MRNFKHKVLAAFCRGGFELAVRYILTRFKPKKIEVTLKVSLVYLSLIAFLLSNFHPLLDVTMLWFSFSFSF